MRINKLGQKTKELLKEDFFEAKSQAELSSADVIRILRDKHGLTQSELADQAKLTQATISSLEKGRIKLGVERAKSLARALKVHPAVLVFPGWDAHPEDAA